MSAITHLELTNLPQLLCLNVYGGVITYVFARYSDDCGLVLGIY